MKKEELLSEVALPYLGDPPAEQDEFDLPPSIAQRWIFKRVLDLGWTVERFGKFDRHISQVWQIITGQPTNRNESARNTSGLRTMSFLLTWRTILSSERIPGPRKPDFYHGPWQLGCRDIDPSSLLRRTYRGHLEPHVTSWWAPTQFDAWEEDLDETLWLKSADLLPTMTSLPVVTDPQTDREWFVLECFYNWEEPTPPEVDKDDVSRRHIWYGLSAYLVKSDDEESLCSWARKNHFKSHWMPESQPQIEVFLGEFFRLPAFEYFDNPYNGRAGWTRGNDSQHLLPCDVLVTTDSYLHEAGLHDCSIEESISIELPAKWLVDKMGLSWRGSDGRFYDRVGNMVAQDPSIRTAGPQALLMNKELLTDFLNSQGVSASVDSSG